MDCRRTDRHQPIYAVASSIKRKGEEEKEAGGASASSRTIDSEIKEEEENGQGGMNGQISSIGHDSRYTGKKLIGSSSQHCRVEDNTYDLSYLLARIRIRAR